MCCAIASRAPELRRRQSIRRRRRPTSYRRGCRVPWPWPASAKSASKKLSPTSTTARETHAKAILIQALCAVKSDVVQARTHAAQMQVTAVRQLQYACTSRAVVVAHGAAACHSVHPRGQLSIPAPRGTSDASARQRVGVSRPDKLSNTTRHQGSTASAVSTTSVAMRRFV